MTVRTITNVHSLGPLLDQGPIEPKKLAFFPSLFSKVSSCAHAILQCARPEEKCRLRKSQLSYSPADRFHDPKAKVRINEQKLLVTHLSEGIRNNKAILLDSKKPRSVSWDDNKAALVGIVCAPMVGIRTEESTFLENFSQLMSSMEYEKKKDLFKSLQEAHDNGYFGKNVCQLPVKLLECLMEKFEQEIKKQEVVLKEAPVQEPIPGSGLGKEDDVSESTSEPPAVQEEDAPELPAAEIEVEHAQDVHPTLDKMQNLFQELKAQSPENRRKMLESVTGDSEYQGFIAHVLSFFKE